jgi:choline dehydrogenase-like flavoprotein
MNYDVIVIGAGSAGCPLAARLSEDPHRSVLLLDAGPHYKSIDEFPEALQQGGSLASSFPGHPNNWSFMARLTPELLYSVPRGKVVGGSSALNGTVFIRGVPEDFDGWASLGNEEWSYQKVLPYFRKLESDKDFQDDFHGTDGPIPVRRPKPQEWNPPQQAFVQACLDAGFPEDSDMNSPTSIGVGALPLNNINGLRMNTAITYLTPNLHRPNLTVWGEVLVGRVLFEGRRAVGIEAERQGQKVVIYGGEIILSAGAVKSPHLLLLSGIGPADELRRFDIAVIQDSPYVGKDFTDHPAVMIMYRTKKELPVHSQLPMIQTGLHYTAEGSEARGDMELLPFCFSMSDSFLSAGESGDSPLLALPSFFRHPFRTLAAIRGISVKRLIEQARRGRDLIIGCSLQEAVSRGEMRLVSADPKVQPELHYNYLSDPFDRKRMREGVRLTVQLLQGKAFKDLVAERTVPTDTHLASDASLDNWMYTNLGTAIHMSGSCKMGPPTDMTAVVDQYGRVHGVERLRVVDTSIQPNVVRRPANATAIMIGERAVEWVS